MSPYCTMKKCHGGVAISHAQHLVGFGKIAIYQQQAQAHYAFFVEFGAVLSAGFIPIVTFAIGLKVMSTIVTLFHTMLEEES